MKNLVYVGTYTRSGASHGIEVFQHEPSSGALTHLTTVAEVDPSFLALDPSGRFLFAVSEGRGRDGGAVASYRIDGQTLVPLSRQLTGGGEPCHLCTDPSGRWLLVVNHEHGSVAVLPIDGDGRLGERTDLQQHHGSGPGPTQKGPHAHFVTFDPAQERVLVTDKGIDKVMRYRLDPDAGKLVPDEPAFAPLHAGAAPRHIAFHPGGAYLFINGEADMTLTSFSYDRASGSMRELQVISTLPDGTSTDGVSTAQVLVEPGGRFVYVSNRGHDSIALFGFDESSARLTSLGHQPTQGQTPRNFVIDPSGGRMYVANQRSDSIVQFLIDNRSGALVPTGEVTSVGAPVCILFT